MEGRNRQRPRKKVGGTLFTMKMSKEARLCLEYISDKMNVSSSEVVEKLLRSRFKRMRQKELGEKNEPQQIGR